MRRYVANNMRGRIEVGIGLFLALAFLIAACNPSKRLENGQYLLTKNNIIYRRLAENKAQKNNLINNKASEGNENEFAKLVLPPELAVGQLDAYIKQKPNTKILGLIPLHLLVYNLVDPERMKEKRVLKDRKIDKKNSKIAAQNLIRAQQGKKPKPYLSKEPGAFSDEWVRDVGEAPVVFDSVYMEGSVIQLTKYLHSKGYFDAKVGDSVKIESNYAQVYYILRTGKPYTINQVTYQLDDTTLASIVYKDSVNSLIHFGANYDEDVFKSERDRITKVLKNDGYYAFSKEYIHYEYDTNAATKKVTLIIGIKKFAYLDPNKPDSVIETLHHRYFIRNVYLQMDYNPIEPLYKGTDTTFANGYKIIYPQYAPVYHPHALLSKIYIKPGDRFEAANVDNTYNGLLQLKAFRYVNIHWVVSQDSNKLDCYIQLMPNTKQSLALEGVGNNTGGDLGIQGDLLYQDNNLLKGAEVLQIKFKYAMEAQTLLTDSSKSKSISKSVTLNTIDVGPDVSLSVPRPLNVFKFIPIDPAIANPQTAFKITGDYQSQPDYQRYIVTGSYGYDWNCWKHDHMNITLFEVNYVSAINSEEFLSDIQHTDNYFLLNSFTTHVITDTRVTWIYNNQAISKLRNFHYLKLSAECSGLVILHTVDHYLDQVDNLFGHPYSHYVKGDIDWRPSIVLSKDDKLAFRALLGVGVPVLNNYGTELPFDKSYWGGGSDDIRAWSARTLGPGASTQSLSFAQVGDVKIEFNQEYRLNIIKFFGLGFFFDEGNIWLMNNNPSVLHGNFLFNNTAGRYNFYREIAVGTGIGLRFDFTYFIFRLDFGMPLLDPSTPESIEQIHHTAQFDKTVVNIGIGFPF
jgi:outer membrane protein assembly factor BamA